MVIHRYDDFQDDLSKALKASIPDDPPCHSPPIASMLGLPTRTVVAAACDAQPARSAWAADPPPPLKSGRSVFQATEGGPGNAITGLPINIGPCLSGAAFRNLAPKRIACPP